MTEITFYIQTGASDPLSMIALNWVKLYHLDQVQVRYSEYSWNSIGDLPNIRLGSIAIGKQNLLAFLKQAYNPNSDLSFQQQQEAEFLQEYCLSKLFPSTQYGMWLQDTTPKAFYNSSSHWLLKLLYSPIQNIKFNIEKHSIKQYLARQHGILTSKQGYLLADEAHQYLSQRLGSSKFFFEGDFPRSTDIVIYSYLKYQQIHLLDYSHVEDSLKKYQNLLQFIEIMEGAVVSASSSTEQVFYARPPPQVQIFTPRLFLAIDIEKSSRKYQVESTLKKKYQIVASEESPLKKRIYISCIAGVLLLYLKLRDQQMEKGITNSATSKTRTFMSPQIGSVGTNASQWASQYQLPAVNFLIGHVKIRQLTVFEKIDLYKDRCILLEFRKALMRAIQAIRLLAMMIISKTWFEAFIICVILANSVVLALEGAVDASILESYQNMFLYIYTAECGLKIIGLGFIRGKKAYLRDSWNILDLIIVVTGWIELLSHEGVSLSSLRTLRVLRPLKSISSIQGIKIIFIVLVNSIRPLLSTMLILFFFCLIFSIAGLQVWTGVLKLRCIFLNSGQFGDLCGYQSCSLLSECGKTLDNPNFGATNFDNIFYSLLTIFQFITLEGWVSIMIFLQKTFSPWVVLFFIPLVFIGAFFLINLTLAVIKLKLTDTIKEQSKQRKQKKKKHRNSEYYNSLTQLNTEIKISPQLIDFQDVQESFAVLQFDRIPNRSLSPLKKDWKSPGHSDQQENFIQQKESFQVRKQKSFGTKYGGTLFLEQQGEDDKNGNKEIEKLLANKVALEYLCSKKSLSQKIVQRNKELKFAAQIISPFLQSSSSEDILPVSTIQELKVSPVYTFSYKIPRLPSGVFPNQLFNHFKALQFKFTRKKAYEMTVIKSKQIVQSIRHNDKKTRIVIGKSSLFQVYPNGNFQQINFTQLSLWSIGFLGYLQRCKHAIFLIVTSKAFNNLISLCVFLNTIILAIDHHGISDQLAQILFAFNLGFTLIFLVQMTTKLLGLGVTGYFRQTMNYFDGLIVVLSVIQLVAFNDSSLSAFRTVRIFRMFRILRVARLFRYLHEMRELLRAVNRSLSISLYLALLLLIFTMIFALVGMQLFGGQFDFPDGKPRANFDSFHWAFVTTFQVLSLQNWNLVLYNVMRTPLGPSSSLFLVIWIVIGNFVLLNLFLAILLDTFGQKSQQIDPNSSFAKSRTILTKKQQKDMIDRIQAEGSFDSLNSFIKTDTEIQDEISKIPCEKSYFLFSKSNLFRKISVNIIYSQRFQAWILILIILSSIKLAADTYFLRLQADSTQNMVSSILDVVFTCLFTVQFIIKSVAKGLVLDKKSYLRDHWNQIDFLIVAVSWIDIVLSSDSIQSFKVVRLLRTLRPLRFISHNLSMKIVVSALIDSTVSIINVGVVVLMVWLLFAILGVSFFAGKLYSCENPQLETEKECLEAGFEWVNQDTNFDNVLQAMMTLFIVSSLEGWPDIMYKVIDATEVGKGPIKNYNPAAAYFFVIFIIIGSFFFLNLFIGVVFQRFQESRKSETTAQGMFLTNEQQRWVQIQRLIPKSKPQIKVSKIPEKGIRKCFYQLSKSVTFDIFISFCIFINMLQMAMIYDQAPQDYIQTLETLNFILTIVFVLEAIIKITGFGPKSYFFSNQNRFDFFVVIASVIELVFSQFGESELTLLRVGPQLARVFRIARVVKLFRLVRSLKDIQAIVQAIKYSIPSMLNVLSLLLLIYFIYSILGAFLFFEIEQGKIIDQYTNFWNIKEAMITLIRASTGEDWHLIMFDCVKHEPISAYLYFSSFSILTSFIMLNLFVMVIIQALDDHYQNPESHVDIFNRIVKDFKLVWARYSSAHYGVKISQTLLIDMMHQLGLPLGVDPDVKRLETAKIIATLQVPINDKEYIYYHDILFSLFKRAYGKFRLKKATDKLRMKIILNQERRTLKKIRLKTESKMKKREMRLSQEFNIPYSSEGVFLNFLVMKKVFVAWRNWKDEKSFLNSESEDEQGFLSERIKTETLFL